MSDLYNAEINEMDSRGGAQVLTGFLQTLHHNKRQHGVNEYGRQQSQNVFQDSMPSSEREVRPLINSPQSQRYPLTLPFQQSIDLSVARGASSIQNPQDSYLNERLNQVLASQNSYSYQQLMSKASCIATSREMSEGRNNNYGLITPSLQSCAFSAPNGTKVNNNKPLHSSTPSGPSRNQRDESDVANLLAELSQTHGGIITTMNVGSSPKPIDPASKDKVAGLLTIDEYISQGRMQPNKRQRTAGQKRSHNGQAVARNLSNQLFDVASNNMGLNLSMSSSGGGAGAGGSESVRVKEEGDEGTKSKVAAFASSMNPDAAKLFQELCSTVMLQRAASTSADGTSQASERDLQAMQASERDLQTLTYLLNVAGIAAEGIGSGLGLEEGVSPNILAAAEAARLTIMSNSLSGVETSPDRRHGRGMFKCPDCGKGLSSMHNLKLHIASVHKGIFQYRCPLCQKGLRQERDLRGHLSNRHQMKKEFRCTVCGNEFGYKRNLKQHMVSYHGWKEPIIAAPIPNTQMITMLQGEQPQPPPPPSHNQTI